MQEGLGELNDYSSDQFSLDEHCHYYMERQSILSYNHAAVEFIYMLEVECLTSDSGSCILFLLTTLVNLDCMSQ
jgi:hypothetical protein